MSMRRDRTVILGAGLCGLSAAYHLEEKAETDHLILEQAHEVGGLARTETYEGFSFDHSIHILYSRDPYAIDLICGKLLQGNLVRQTRHSFCYTAGVYTEYPYQMNNYGLPPAIIAKNLMGLIEASQASGRNGPPRQFEEWIYETYGRGIAEHFMIPYNRRQWAWDLQDMNYDWIADRVPLPELRDVLLGAMQPPEKKVGPNQEFWYPLEGGIQALPRAFLRYIPPERLLLGATVVTVDSVRREISLADGRRVPYDRLISTIPLPALVKLLAEAAPPEIRQCARGLKYNAVHTVNIGLDGTELGGKQKMHWVYLPEEDTIFHRMSFPGNFSPWMVPRGCTSIQVEISESVYRPRDRAALVQASLQGLVRTGILSSDEARPVSQGGRVRVARMLTLDPAYIIYDLKHRENTQAIKDYLEPLDISSNGRFGEWEYFNMDHAILSGRKAAWNTFSGSRA
jgi:UDP-galactopyranose mutase